MASGIDDQLAAIKAVADANAAALLAMQADIDAAILTLAAVKAKTDLIGAGAYAVTSPTAEGGTITLYAGQDYVDAEAIRVTRTLWTGPDLDGEIASFRVARESEWLRRGYGALLAVDFEIAQDGTTLTFDIELTAEQTALLNPAPSAAMIQYRYQIVATVDGVTRVLAGAGSDVEDGILQALKMIRPA